ncbi:KCC1 [Enterospora canceri]|uniref:KCC1 n=1 Tax=Enterospora canceri TaxID=1081671 RepID=A0A1Y1S505_9MICR|nr:KCC1 [Enterospora canceri]
MLIGFILAAVCSDETERLGESEIDLKNHKNLRSFGKKVLNFYIREQNMYKVENVIVDYKLALLDNGIDWSAHILVRDDETEKYVVKVITGISPKSVRATQVEVEKTKWLKHENIVKMYSSARIRVKQNVEKGATIENRLMVIEYLNVDTFEIQENVKMIRKMLKDVLSALEYMHRHKIAHLDIKPSNIRGIETEPNEITWKLFDMESAMYLYRDGLKRPMNVYTPMYTDVLHKNEASFAADIYQVGMTVWSLMMHDVERETKRIESYQSEFTGFEMDFNEKIPERMRSFIREATNKDPKKRPTAAELLSHPFLTEDE